MRGKNRPDLASTGERQVQRRRAFLTEAKAAGAVDVQRYGPETKLVFQLRVKGLPPDNEIGEVPQPGLRCRCERPTRARRDGRPRLAASRRRPCSGTSSCQAPREYAWGRSYCEKKWVWC